MKNKTTIAIVLIIFIAIVLAVWQKVGIKKVNETSKTPPIINKTTVSKENSVDKNNSTNDAAASPASIFCNRIGGKTEMKKNPNGGQYGLCNFDNGGACEVEALKKGDCPVGGIKTAGYDTEAKKYCVLIGGKLNTTKNDICTFKDESTCKVDDLFAGTCRMGQNVKAVKQ